MATGDSQARIRITAQDETQRAFASAGKSLAQLESAAGAAVGGFVALAPAIAAAFAIDSFKGAVNLLDSLNDISDSTGASIEALGKLEGAARKNGATMDDVGGILVKFNAALSGATADSPLAKALASIGLNAAELRKQDPADALQTVAKALSGFADDGNKARLVQELFGKSVAKAGPFLKDLAEGANKAQEGLTEQAKAAELFNKNLAALRYEGELYARSVVSKVLPALNDWLDALNKIGGFSGAIKARLGLDEQGQLQKQAADLTAEMTRLGDAIDRMGEEQRRSPTDFMAVRIEKARTKLAELQKQSFATAAALKGVADQATGANYSNEGRNFSPTKQVGDLASATKVKPENLFIGPEIPQATLDALKALESTDTAKIKELRAQLAELLSIRAEQGGGAADEAILNIEEALQKLDPATKAAADAQDELNRLLAATPTGQVEAYQKQIELLASALEKTGDPQQARKIKEALDAVNQSIEGIGKDGEKSLDKLSAFAEEASRNIQDELGSTLEQVLGGHFDNIGQMWLSLINKLVAQAIAANLGEALFGKGGAGSGGGLLGEFFGSLFSGARANGGPVSAGRTYLVGERGPELFTPAGSGVIVPNNGLAAAAGGSTTINVAAGPSKAEVLSAIQLAVRASEAKTDQRLRRAGI